MVETNRDELAVLVEQQAALRRVATVVARGVPPSQVFAGVVMELSRCLGTDYAALFRCETGGAATLVAAWDGPGATKEPVGGRFSLEVENLAATVLRTGRAARMDSHGNAPGSAAANIRELGSRSGVGAPIVVPELPLAHPDCLGHVGLNDRRSSRNTARPLVVRCNCRVSRLAGESRG
jgi:GAF domain-containing protein